MSSFSSLFLLVTFIFTRMKSQFIYSNDYIMVQRSYDYATANSFCNSQFSTSLASIHSVSQNSEVGSLCRNNRDTACTAYRCDSCWIGLNDIDSERVTSQTGWIWEDSTTTDYYQWGSNEPSNSEGNEDCVQILAIGTKVATGADAEKWSDIPCDLPRYFLCNRYNPSTTHYFFVPILQNWPAANSICQSLYGTHLATIVDATQNAEANGLCGNLPTVSGDQSCWIGLNDEDNERGTSKAGWVWEDGTAYFYSNWKEGEPNNTGDEDCVAMRIADAEWNDALCGTRTHQFLCNKPPSSDHYLLIPSKKTWTNAKAFCKNVYGTELASIIDASQNTEASDLCGGQSCWIGANDIDNERGSTRTGWSWADDTVFDYAKWGAGEPNNAGNEDCVAMRSDSWWNDYPCDISTFAFLCNKYPTSTNYYFIPIATTWADAETFCNNAFGTNLASIHNENERSELAALSDGERAWIGLNDIVNERVTDPTGWVWSDGSLFDYSDWDDGEPNDFGLGEDCVSVDSTPQSWNDGDCETQLPFACNRYNPTAAPTTAPTKAPSSTPTPEPTPSPTLSPTQNPTNIPTVFPTFDPTVNPTLIPSMNPTINPTFNPTADPSAIPTINPTLEPTMDPTLEPTLFPSNAPSFSPTSSPSPAPTFSPTRAPTPHCPNLEVSVTDANGLFDKSKFEGLYIYIHSNFSQLRPYFEVPQIALDKHIEYVGQPPNGHWMIEAEGSDALTFGPTDSQYPPYGATSTQMDWSHNKISNQYFHLLIECVESFAPIAAPTSAPTMSPSNAPSLSPSQFPTFFPSYSPTTNPTQSPLHSPSQDPTNTPSFSPTFSPSISPTMPPTNSPISFCLTLNVRVSELDGVSVTDSAWNGLYKLDEENPSFGVSDWYGIGLSNGRYIKYVGSHWVIIGDNNEILSFFSVNDADNYPPIGIATKWKHENVQNENGAIVTINCSQSIPATFAPTLSPIINSSQSQLPSMTPTNAPTQFCNVVKVTVPKNFNDAIAAKIFSESLFVFKGMFNLNYPFWSVQSGQSENQFDGSIYFNGNEEWILSINDKENNYYKVYTTKSKKYFVPMDAVWIDTDTSPGISQSEIEFVFECNGNINIDIGTTSQTSNDEKQANANENVYNSLWFWLTIILMVLFVVICALFLCYLLKKRKQNPDLIDFNAVPQKIQIQMERNANNGVAHAAVLSLSDAFTPSSLSPQEEEGQGTTHQMSPSEDNVFAV